MGSAATTASREEKIRPRPFFIVARRRRFGRASDHNSKSKNDAGTDFEVRGVTYPEASLYQVAMTGFRALSRCSPFDTTHYVESERGLQSTALAHTVRHVHKIEPEATADERAPRMRRE